MIAVESIPSKFGDITIYRNRKTGYYIYSQHQCCQSVANSNGVSLASYIHAMYGLIVQTAARDVLLIGCGGGTLGTMLARSGRSVTIVDIDPLSFALAQRYFALPAEVKTSVADGRAYLEGNEKVYDIIVMDAFVGEDVPEQFCSAEFFVLVRTRLKKFGYILFNVLVAHDFDYSADELAANMTDAGFEVRILEAAGLVGRNAIVAGGNVATLRCPTLVVDPVALRDEVLYELKRMRFRMERDLFRRARRLPFDF